MKLIQSAGGPLIGLDRAFLPCWGGIADQRFVGDGSPFLNDYEAACSAILMQPPTDIATLVGRETEGLLMAMPYPTAVIEGNGSSAYIAQVIYADPAWSFDRIGREIFDTADYQIDDNSAFFGVQSCTYMLFDSAYAGEDVADDHLSFKLEAGLYTCSVAYADPDTETSLILYRIVGSR